MKNRVKEILTTRGFKGVQLTDELLRKLEVGTPHRFNKIWHNDAEMTQREIIAFKNWLGLDSIDE
ncbi:MAG: hypothetical protein LBL04_15485, partial [Bacteroidales bacterium]|nr:hypothetical protein [Bacteroidales bacterium]